MKIYLAAPYGKMNLMQKWEQRLVAAGHECTAKWIRGDEENMTLANAAQMDLDDIDAADVVISYVLPKGTMFSSGGRHVEFGYALARDKIVVCVGNGPENVFHNLPQVVIVENFEAALAYLT